MAARRKRRVQYLPEMVVARVLSDEFLRTLVYVVYSSSMPMHATEIAREVSKLLGKQCSPQYVCTYLRRLERWGVVRPYRDPVNGKLVWWKADTRTAEMIASELQKSEIRKVMGVVGDVENI